MRSELMALRMCSRPEHPESSLTSYGAACHALHKTSKVPSISMNSLALDSNLIIKMQTHQACFFSQFK